MALKCHLGLRSPYSWIQPIRKDRNRHGGGVAIYVSSSIPFKQLQLPHSDLELLIVECTLGHQLFTIGGFCRPPGASAVVMDNLHSVISLLRPQNFANLVLLGDFNIDPNTLPSPQLSDSFNHLLTDFCLSQVVSEPTRTSGRSSSTIDLAVVSNMNSFLSCEVLAPLANSDHKTVVLTLSSPSNHKHFPQPRKTVWIYKRADIQLAKCLLRDLPMASTSGSIDIFWKKWSKSFLAAIRKSIPSKLVPIKSSNPGHREA